jgi:hypothetical protein
MDDLTEGRLEVSTLGPSRGFSQSIFLTFGRLLEPIVVEKGVRR